MRTTQPWAYAAGDVTGGLLVAHTASATGPLAARNALARAGEEKIRKALGEAGRSGPVTGSGRGGA